VEREGESYRHSLENLVDELELDRNVCFIDQFLSRQAIDRLLARASVVVLPYDSTEQTSSGVLAEAITAAVPVVATAFPQALEMEAQGAALTVPHRSPEQMAAAAALLIERPEAAADMVQAQLAVSGASSWETVGANYLKLVESVTEGAAA
jgi:glycosyltransferase involved in cell wall biosynthesis